MESNIWRSSVGLVPIDVSCYDLDNVDADVLIEVHRACYKNIPTLSSVSKRLRTGDQLPWRAR